MQLTVLYWNTAGSKTNDALALVERREYDVIALQEPWYNRQQKTTYCPARGRYRRIFGNGRAALYVHKRHGIGTWTQRTGQDWCSATFGEGSESITIWSVYSPNPQERPWQSPLTELAASAPRGRNVIVGDMNLHHPLWDREGRTSPRVGELLTLAQRWTLSLATPYGEPTRVRQGQRDSTIDHAWASESLQVTYLGDPGYAGSDHRAQLIRIEGAPSMPKDRPEG